VHLDSLPAALILAAAAAVLWSVARPAAVFVVRVRAGRPETVRGTVTAAFLAAVAEVFREFGVAAGEVRGVARGRRIALKFSAGVPPTAAQRLRNWWALSGWSAGPRRGRERGPRKA
jgi:hypothetical protein